MIAAVIWFAVGLVCLIKGGDWFVDGATALAKRFRVPDILIGATVVSIGTTLPEVLVSATSAVTGHGEIAYGNAIGSIICNVALIAAITITICPAEVEKKSLKTPVLFFFLAAAYYVLNAYVFGTFSRLSGVILLALFVIYMFVTVKQMTKTGGGTALPQKDPNDGGEDLSRQEKKDVLRELSRTQAQEGETAEKEKPLPITILLLVVGAALIAIGADLLVDNGTLIAAALGVPESVIALTFVALGTSLPELVTAITSLAKGHGSLSLGNIIGANLFNLVLVCGVSITLSPFQVPVSAQIAGMNASLVIEIPVMLFVMLFLTIPALVRGKLSRVQGVVLLGVYAAFLCVQFLVL